MLGGPQIVIAVDDQLVDLRADVCDLPHHGSFVAASPDWLAAVDPAIVLQSSGPGRLRDDKWAGLFSHTSIRRFVSDRVGMVEIAITADGRMATTQFKKR